MKIILELNGLKKSYGKKEAVRGLDLQIAQGELFVLLGPNGAGKTSTLKMICGLLKPNSGSIRIGDYDMVKQPLDAKRLISFVPDMPYIYEKLTPRELLRFIGKLYNMDPKTIEQEGRKLLDFFSLAHAHDVLIEEFSHGMKQKVILAASLLHRPEVFILDEPMVGLDPISIKSFKDFLKQKSREGMTILFSTHTLSLAEEIADRIGIMDQGKMIALGTMDELRAKYQSKANLEQMFMTLMQKEEVR